MRIGLLPLLFVVFLVLKLANIVAWSWWIIFLPLILSFFVGIGIFLYSFLTTLHQIDKETSCHDLDTQLKDLLQEIKNSKNNS